MSLITDSNLWGVQPAGFYAPNVEECLAAIRADFWGTIDPELDLDPDSILGQEIAIYARQEALFWAGLKVIHDSNNPDNAEGDLLDDLLALAGITREGPRPTIVSTVCDLDAGTTLLAGVSLASVTNRPDLTYTPVADYTAVTSGGQAVRFQASANGPQVLVTGTLAVIQTGETGWHSVTNPTPAAIGSAGMTDAEGRLLREQELARAGSTTTRALEADILQLEGVTSVQVLENMTDSISADGLAPHSFEVVLAGSPDEATLARTIWENRPAGIPSYGSNSASYVDDRGTTRTVSYSLVSAVSVLIQIRLLTGAGYISDTQFKIDLCAALTATAIVGGTVYWSHINAASMLPGVLNVPLLAIGLNPEDLIGDSIEFTPRQLATFLFNNVTFI